MNASIRRQLIELAEPEYQTFSKKLLPQTNNILGVRLTKLRILAKQLANETNRSYLVEDKVEFFEEIMLQGMIIGYIKGDIQEVLSVIKDFVPKIDNWSVCDSFCVGLKITKQYKEEMWDFIQPYLRDSNEFHVRFGVVMFLNYFIDEEYVKEALDRMERITCEAYYAKMGIAWAISMYYVKLPKETMPFLKNNYLDDFTYNKALQKIIESQKVKEETRNIIRKMKR